MRAAAELDATGDRRARARDRRRQPAAYRVPGRRSPSAPQRRGHRAESRPSVGLASYRRRETGGWSARPKGPGKPSREAGEIDELVERRSPCHWSISAGGFDPIQGQQMVRISSSRSDRLIATSLGLARHGASWGDVHVGPLLGAPRSLSLESHCPSQPRSNRAKNLTQHSLCRSWAMLTAPGPVAVTSTAAAGRCRRVASGGTDECASGDGEGHGRCEHVEQGDAGRQRG